MAKDIFKRLQEKQPQLEKEQQVETIPRGPLLQPIVPPATPQSSPTEKLLDFIVNRWRKPAIRVREICQFGPGSIRDRKSALSLAENLAEAGWLAPLPPTRRYDERRWRIVRGGEG